MHLFIGLVNTSSSSKTHVVLIQSKLRQTLVSSLLPVFCLFLHPISLFSFLTLHLCLFLLSLCSLLWLYSQTLGGLRKQRVTERKDRIISFLWAQTGQCWGPIGLETLSLRLASWPCCSRCRLPSSHHHVLLDQKGQIHTAIFIDSLSLFFFTLLSWHCSTLSVLFCFCLSQLISARLSCQLLMWKRALFHVAPVKPLISNFR